MFVRFDGSSSSCFRDIIGSSKFKVGHVTLMTPCLRVIVILMLGLDRAYLLAKFDNYSFSRSRDMVGCHQNLNGSRNLTTPFSGMVCHPRASTCYNQHAYQIEVSISTQYEDMEGDTKY